ncbi:MAG: VRR-NUC domain-containing protein [Planktothrix sp.]
MKVSAETKIQIDFVDHCHRYYPDLLVIAIPNGAKRSPADGYIHKRMGTVSGVPDIFIPALRLWIEFKAIGGKLSPAQKLIIHRLQKIGYQVEVCYSTESAIETVNQKIISTQLFENQAVTKNLPI